MSLTLHRLEQVSLKRTLGAPPTRWSRLTVPSGAARPVVSSAGYRHPSHPWSVAASHEPERAPTRDQDYLVDKSRP